MRRALSAWFLVMVVSAFASAALPPRYGGDLRLPASTPLSRPIPGSASTPLEAAIERAVFDLPGELGTLAEQDGVMVLTLPEGVRRHDRRALRAADIASSLRRLDRSDTRWWLAPIARRGGALDVSVDDPRTLRIRPVNRSVDLRALLHSPALGVEARPGRGTGPFRARMVRDELRLFQFRNAYRGAPYLRSVIFSAPRSRENELRALVLGEIHGSWLGSSVYGGEPARPTRTITSSTPIPVLLVPSEARRSQLRGLTAIIDRARLARTGLSPGEIIAPGLQPPRPVGATPAARTWRLVVRQGDLFSHEIARALAATFDEAGRRLEIRTVPAAGWQNALQSSWDLRIVQLPPQHPISSPALAPHALLAAAYAATGETDRAGQLWTRALRGRPPVPADAQGLPAIVLGTRAPQLFLDEAFNDAGFDGLARLSLENIHQPREAP